MKPLGWWLRHVHELLETSMGQALAAESLTRRQWQVLNSLAVGAKTTADVDAMMSPFVAEEGSMAANIAELRARGWATGDVALTEEGRAAHVRVEERVMRFRKAVMDGISEEDRLTTMRTLERCAANLEALTAA